MGAEAAGGADRGWGGSCVLRPQRTCLTTTSTWTSAGRESPITCAATPCTAAAPPTRSAAARTARPGASSAPCARPGAQVRRQEVGTAAELGPPGQGVSSERVGGTQKGGGQGLGLSSLPVVWGWMLWGRAGWGQRNTTRNLRRWSQHLPLSLSRETAPRASAPRSPGPASFLPTAPDRGLCSALQRGPDRSRTGGRDPLPARL